MATTDSNWDKLNNDYLSKQLSKYNLLLEQLSTVSQVNKLTDVIRNDHMETKKLLNLYLQESQLSHNKQIRRLELQRTDLTTTLTHFHQSLSILNDSNQASQKINQDIDTNDREILYLKETLTFLNNIRTLKNNILLIQSALNESDYIVAATAIYDINQLPNEVIDSKFAGEIIPTPDLPFTPRQLLTRWVDELRTIFKEQFTKAVSESDITNLTKFFKLFPLINESNLGLDLYAKYITDMISMENQKFTMGAMKFNSGFDRILLQLFNTASTVINEHSKIIARAYGIQFMTVVMEKIEIEVELQSGLVLNYFKEKRLTQENANNKSLIIEFSNFLQNWSMYTRFFSVRWNEFKKIDIDNDTDTDYDDSKEVTNNSSQTPLQLVEPIVNGGFMKKLRDEQILSLFENKIRQYLVNSFSNSVKLEELPSLNNLITLDSVKHDDFSSWPISSVLEDFTLLIRQTLVFTVNTGQYTILSNFLQQLIKFIQNEYLIKYLQDRFKKLQEKLNTAGSIITLKKYVPKNVPTDENVLSTTPSFAKLTNLVHGDNSNTNLNAMGNSISNANSNNTGSAAQGTSNNLQFSKFNIRGAFAQIQSNLHSVVTQEDVPDDIIIAFHQYLIYVNTLYGAVVSIEKLLIQEIIHDNTRLLPDNFPFNNESVKLMDELSNCKDHILTQVGKLQKWSLKYIFQNVCLPKLRNMLNGLFINGLENNYICGMEGLDDIGGMKNFIKNWNQLMIPLQNVLYHVAYLELLELMVNFVKNNVEQRFWSLQVNELGAVKLDRELSLFIDAVCGLQYNLREHFTKLTQIVLVLGFDDDDFDVATGDVKDELATTIHWVLSPTQRVQARNLKVDRR